MTFDLSMCGRPRQISYVGTRKYSANVLKLTMIGETLSVS